MFDSIKRLLNSKGNRRYDPDTPLFSGGSGSSEADAVVINCDNNFLGIRAEYRWISERFGKKNKDWKPSMMGHYRGDNGRMYENFSFQLESGENRVIIFDITSFYGKF